MSAPELDAEIDEMLLKGLAVEVVKYAIARLVEDSDPSDLLNDAPEFLGLDGLPDEDWDAVRDLVEAADIDVDVTWEAP